MVGLVVRWLCGCECASGCELPGSQPCATPRGIWNWCNEGGGRWPRVPGWARLDWKRRARGGEAGRYKRRRNGTFDEWVWGGGE